LNSKREIIPIVDIIALPTDPEIVNHLLGKERTAFLMTHSEETSRADIAALAQARLDDSNHNASIISSEDPDEAKLNQPGEACGPTKRLAIKSPLYRILTKS
jgi:hypothetical protein